jgi:putative transposase
MRSATELSESVGVTAACAALGVPRATWYRHERPPSRPSAPREPRPRPPLALSAKEREEVLEELESERFVDSSPRQVWATLLDDDRRYLCSVRTMYRLLAAAGEVRERRNQLRHPAYSKPELLANGPNEVWTWDVTRLKGPAKWTYYYLYVILDLFSRLVVGWMVARRETASLAKQLVSETYEKHGIEADQITLHADRGSVQTSKGVALLLSDLGVTKSHSRPYTSNDNAHSESQFKTLKYHPAFPERFESLEHARDFCRTFFAWYNTEHRHGSLALLTPSAVHYGRGEAILAERSVTLGEAFAKHPERFKGRAPKTGTLPKAVWINPPTPEEPSSPPLVETPGPEPQIVSTEIHGLRAQPAASPGDEAGQLFDGTKLKDDTGTAH